MSEWKLIETAPKDGRKVLACFKGQFEWLIFVAHAYPLGVLADVLRGLLIGGLSPLPHHKMSIHER